MNCLLEENFDMRPHPWLSLSLSVVLSNGTTLFEKLPSFMLTLVWQPFLGLGHLQMGERLGFSEEPHLGQSALEARRPLAMSHAIRASSPRRVSSIKLVVFQGLGVAIGVGAAV